MTTAGPTVGSQVSHYRLERVLGAGGMGQVFLARDLTLDRPVAIKFLTATQDDHARRRLLAEARSVAALDHPAICTVHEVVTDDVVGDFIVMNYVEGETLAHRLKSDRLTPTETISLMTPLLQALGAAHRAGVVHRDIKPQNIIITPSGLPKLLDFGIAKRMTPEPATEDATTATMLTGDGDVVGTLAYMSPEQLQGRQVDARSDLFSLGSVLYECLTGLRAFAGGSRAETIGQLLYVDPPPPSSVILDLPPVFDSVCADLLRKVPSERFQSAEEVLGAIRGTGSTQRVAGVRKTLPVARSIASAASNHRTVALAAGVIAVLALVVAGWMWRGGTSLPEGTPAAREWFDRGVEKLREGSYSGARLALAEAVKLSPDYMEAHLRLAEADAELDNIDAAQETVLRLVAELPPNVRLTKEVQLRLDAVRWSVLRDHDKAIAAYQQLADLDPGTASSWLDVGRAEEAAGRRVAAMAHFERARQLNSQYAAAHQRLGVLQSQAADKATALASLDEAIRLHKVNNNLEGEAEATLRKAAVHITSREASLATPALDRVDEIAKGPMYLSLQLRAQFDRARVAQLEGRLPDALKLATDALNRAVENRMGTIASDGLRGLATILMSAGRFDEADAQFDRAIQIAAEQKASRAQMQAQLQLASLRLAQSRYAEAIALVEKPMKYISAQSFTRNEAEAKSVLARAYEGLENYDEARRLASEVLALAESLNDAPLTSVSLDNLAGQAERLGQLPEALALRERLEKKHRDANDHALVAYDLVNRADLLIRLGRGAEAEQALLEVEQAIAAGRQDYKARLPKVALMRALRASIEGRYRDVEGLAMSVGDMAAARPGDNVLFAKVLIEHAQARLGRSRTDIAELAKWPGQASYPALGRELSYWVARTLLDRRSPELALEVSRTAWGAPGARTNRELRWRLAALASQASDQNRSALDASAGATMRTASRDDLQALLAQWSQAGVGYVARPDLAALRKGIS